jgi:hypothetical protein
VQALAPGASLKVPTGHSLQDVAPSCGEKVPAGHAAQASAAEVGGRAGAATPKVPLGQLCAQLAWPGAEEKDPCAQARQPAAWLEAFGAMPKEPAGHAEHCSCPGASLK